MSHRYIVKIFASLGPGAAIVSLTEQVCVSIFPRAYKLGEPEEMESAIDKDLKKLREEYINEVFGYKPEFEKNTGPKVTDNETRKQAFRDLIKIVKKYIEKMVRLSKNKFMRERIYYQRSNEFALYEEANENYNKCRDEITDNLVNQARVICNPDPDEFDKFKSHYFEDIHFEERDDDITKKISEL